MDTNFVYPPKEVRVSIHPQSFLLSLHPFFFPTFIQTNKKKLKKLKIKFFFFY